MRLKLLFSLLLLTACAPSVKLEPEWFPLERIEENKALPSDVARTVDSTCYVHDLAVWQSAFTGAKREAFLRHERVHSKRELAGGMNWYWSYNNSAAFRWEEEKLAFKEQIQHLARHEVPIDVDAFAQFMAGPTYHMIDELSANQFVRDCIYSAKLVPCGCPAAVGRCNVPCVDCCPVMPCWSDNPSKSCCR